MSPSEAETDVCQPQETSSSRRHDRVCLTWVRDKTLSPYDARAIILGCARGVPLRQLRVGGAVFLLDASHGRRFEYRLLLASDHVDFGFSDAEVALLGHPYRSDLGPTGFDHALCWAEPFDPVSSAGTQFLDSIESGHWTEFGDVGMVAQFKAAL
ncbi:hypothetical protein G6O67_006161 [Ophiocordyceps sinensis]|uniref:Uncharacterized protein n=1 Tax=Ophiocordyceps sinensis TaxID=72228 RepID=A0A8H4LV51_9HYPO|nr:hypothetical protein G6O67_006161 [Ophiocordyceps sinensis]